MRRIVGVILLILWIVPFTTTLIGVGMGGGAPLSPTGMVHDALALDPVLFVRLAAWFVLLFPLLPIWWIAYPKGWKNRHG